MSERVSGLRTINTIVDDDEYQRIVKAKGKMTWREFLVRCAERKPEFGDKSKLSSGKL